MKKTIIALAAFATIVSCKNETKKVEETLTQTEKVIDTYIAKNYPKAVESVFDAHGSMRQWDKMNNLCYEMEGRGGIETHTTSLKDRRAKIENEKWSIGHDGTDVWLMQNEKDAYGGNARMYHNLMFYFYAMPFVLGDDGIKYTEIPPTELEGKMYHGVKVSYNDGVGDSPKDDYILYFDPATKEMTWLAYTFTYGSDEKNDKFSYIKYSKWNEVNGLKLPVDLTWYNVVDGKPTDARSTMTFNKITVTETVLDDNVFAKPEGAVISAK